MLRGPRGSGPDYVASQEAARAYLERRRAPSELEDLLRYGGCGHYETSPRSLGRRDRQKVLRAVRTLRSALPVLAETFLDGAEEERRLDDALGELERRLSRRFLFPGWTVAHRRRMAEPKFRYAVGLLAYCGVTGKRELSPSELLAAAILNGREAECCEDAKQERVAEQWKKRHAAARKLAKGISDVTRRMILDVLATEEAKKQKAPRRFPS